MKSIVGGRVVDVPDAGPGDEAVAYVRRKMRKGESLRIEANGSHGLALEVTRKDASGKALSIVKIYAPRGRIEGGVENLIDRNLATLRR